MIDQDTDQEAGAQTFQSGAEYKDLATLPRVADVENKAEVEKTELSPADSIIFEHIPAETEEQIQDRILRKKQDRAAQTEEIGMLKAELTTGLLSQWLENGALKSRELVEDKDALEQTLQQAVESYGATEAGRQDTYIKALRDFLDNPNPSRDELLEIGKTMGSSISERKVRFIPGYVSKIGGLLRQQVEQKLDELVPPGSGFDDEKRDWRTARSSEADVVGRQIISDLHDKASEGYRHSTRQFKERYSNAYSTQWAPEKDFAAVRTDVAVVDESYTAASSELADQIQGSTALLALIARGSLTSREAVEILGGRDVKEEVSLRGMLENYATSQWNKSTNRLPEPSLAGMRITEQDIQAEIGCLAAIEELTRIGGIPAPGTIQNTEIEIRGAVERSQDLFNERMDTPNSLYWHFSTKGLAMISSGQLEAAGGESGRNTGDGSKGVHFIKPGSGLDTEMQYHTYAMGTRTNSGQEVADAFGIALVYRLGDIMSHTPYRDEPLTGAYRGKGNVSEDVTFRDATGGSEYAYPLKEAYLLPMADWDQLKRLKDDVRYTDLFEPGKPVTRIAYEIADRALREAGYSDEWIQAHLLPSEELVKPELVLDRAVDRGHEAALFGETAKRILSRTEEDTTVIVPMSATRGTFEHHDAVKGANAELWQEELVKISLE
jgi:hypothetical protein